MPDNIDYDNLCEKAGEIIMNSDPAVKAVVEALNNFPSKESARAAAKAMAAEAAKGGQYLRAFLCSCAEREIAAELEGELCECGREPDGCATADGEADHKDRT